MLMFAVLGWDFMWGWWWVKSSAVLQKNCKRFNIHSLNYFMADEGRRSNIWNFHLLPSRPNHDGNIIKLWQVIRNHPSLLAEIYSQKVAFLGGLKSILGWDCLVPVNSNLLFYHWKLHQTYCFHWSYFFVFFF